MTNIERNAFKKYKKNYHLKCGKGYLSNAKKKKLSLIEERKEKKKLKHDTKFRKN